MRRHGRDSVSALYPWSHETNVARRVRHVAEIPAYVAKLSLLVIRYKPGAGRAAGRATSSSVAVRLAHNYCDNYKTSKLGFLIKIFCLEYGRDKEMMESDIQQVYLGTKSLDQTPLIQCTGIVTAGQYRREYATEELWRMVMLRISS